MKHVYSRLGELMGANGALYSYSDEVYLVSDAVSMANTRCAAPGIYAKVGLRIGLGPKKKELILPPLTDLATYTDMLTTLGSVVPHIVPRFSSCLGVPRHANNDP
jgi:hypothetical protein